MPAMDGFEVAQAIKRAPEINGTPLVMLTSSGARNDPQRCRALGFSEYLLKPVSGTDLLDAIISATDPSRTPVPAVVHSPATRFLQGPNPLRFRVAEDRRVNQRN